MNSPDSLKPLKIQLRYLVRSRESFGAAAADAALVGSIDPHIDRRRRGGH